MAEPIAVPNLPRHHPSTSARLRLKSTFFTDDYFVTKAGAIDQFMIRMKHSLRDAREMLSNTVAFWMVPELANKNWDAGAVEIPGLTTRFPVGVAGYPPTALK